MALSQKQAKELKRYVPIYQYEAFDAAVQSGDTKRAMSFVSGDTRDKKEFKSLQSDIRDSVAQQENVAAQSKDPQLSTEGQKLMTDLRLGAEQGKQIFGSLPKLGEDPAVQNLLKQAEGLSKGLSSEELRAAREGSQREISQQTATAQRGLEAALRRSGVQGAVAGRQLSDLNLRSLAQQQQAENQLYLQNAQMQRQGMQDYINLQLGVKQFDIGQTQAEKQATLGVGTTIAALGATERGATLAADAARAAVPSSRGGLFGGK